MIRRFLSNQSGGPAAEFALILPAMIVLMFGGTEAGHFAWTQHKLAKAVRDGARYASRLPVESYCDADDPASADFDTDAETTIKAVTATGVVPLADGTAAAPPVVPGLTADLIDVDPVCDAYVDTGIYSALGIAGPVKGPVVTVTINGVPYSSLFAGLGSGLGNSFVLTARSSEAVIGL